MIALEFYSPDGIVFIEIIPFDVGSEGGEKELNVFIRIRQRERKSPSRLTSSPIYTSGCLSKKVFLNSGE